MRTMFRIFSSFSTWDRSQYLKFNENIEQMKVKEWALNATQMDCLSTWNLKYIHLLSFQLKIILLPQVLMKKKNRNLGKEKKRRDYEIKEIRLTEKWTKTVVRKCSKPSLFEESWERISLQGMQPQQPHWAHLSALVNFDDFLKFFFCILFSNMDGYFHMGVSLAIQLLKYMYHNGWGKTERMRSKVWSGIIELY